MRDAITELGRFLCLHVVTSGCFENGAEFMFGAGAICLFVGIVTLFALGK